MTISEYTGSFPVQAEGVLSKTIFVFHSKRSATLLVAPNQKYGPIGTTLEILDADMFEVLL